jgi:hypothetical protein
VTALRRHLRAGAFVLAAGCTTQATTSSSTSPPPTPITNATATSSPIGGGKDVPVLSITAVAWISIAAPPRAPRPVPAGLSPCGVEDLSISLPGMEGATAGQMAGVLDFRNASARSCTLEGDPDVTLADVSGAPLPVTKNHFTTHFSPDKPRPLTWPVLILRPRDLVQSFVLSSNWCGPHVAAWRVTLPDGGSTAITRGWRMGVCEDRSSGSGLAVGGFEPTSGKPKWPLVTMSLDDPRRSETGGIEYVVTLMNVPTRTFRFPSPCPSYAERIIQHHQVVATERLILNCGAIGAVPGGTAVRFAMQMGVPDGVTGAATLVWVLDPPFGFPERVPIDL